jgi:HEAT repeat protein
MHRSADAARAADEALRAAPRSHDAISVKIAALAGADAGPALDAYEGWVRTTEDVFLLDPIARGVLEGIASGGDVGLQISALEELARAGVESAHRRLVELQTRQSQPATMALARLGDRDAAAAIAERAKSGAVRPQAAVEAAAGAGAAGVPALRELLKHADPAVRADAARALGKMRAVAAIDDLRRVMADPNPLASARAAVALTQMGDGQGEARARQMLASELPDFRLIGAEAYADKGDGPWVAAIRPLLEDPNGLLRLQAAELIAPVDPEAARQVITQAATDRNPIVRVEAARVLSARAVAKPPADLKLLRRLLRDADPQVKLRAAETVLGLTAL